MSRPANVRTTVENVEIYYLYDEPFGVDAMLDVFEAVTGLDGFAVAQTPGSPGYVRENHEKGWDTLVSCTYDSLHPTVGADPSHVDLLRRGSDFLRSTTEGVLAGVVEELYWLQVLRPATVESVGRETIESAPVARVEELSDGSVLLVAYENPKDRGDFRSLLEYFSLDWEDY